MKEITVDGVVYVPKGAEVARPFDGMEYKIVRCQNAGVFAGYLESREGQEAAIRKARRLWYWTGAASLSQMAVEGTSSPDSCKFPAEVDRITVTDAIEILDCTSVAQDSIKGVKIWKA